MPTSVLLGSGLLVGFLLTLARVAGVFVFVPLPGAGAGMRTPRIVMTAALTIALYPQWPRIDGTPAVGTILVWLLADAALGAAIGLCVALIVEAFTLGAQILGLQAGYAFASTVDPTTNADSGVLVVFSQLGAGLLFFATGMDRQIVQIFARSLETVPPGTFVLSKSAATQVLGLGGQMFATAFRIALPVVAILIMVDISLALLGRVNAQVQLLSLAFPVKMLLGLMLLGWLLVLMPTLFRAQAETCLRAARGLIGY